MLTQSYEAQRDLLTCMAYHRGSTLVAQREYTYDVLGRPTTHNTARKGSVVNDTFVHNTRSELVGATVNSKDYGYTYDNVGNRTAALEESSGEASLTVYSANELNQYTAISENGAAAFVPQFDADGNQTLIKTETGIWTAVYNVENRPVSFTNEASNTVITCAYDSMGRRAFKQVTVNGTVTLHQHYLYRGYLQISCIDFTRSHHPGLWLITWEPIQPLAARPLAIQINGTWHTYGWDNNKNISELYSTSGFISTAYSYSPFGKVAKTDNIEQPIQWSSEFFDNETYLISYNYRYYNPNMGSWTTRDKMPYNNLYQFVVNNPIIKYDTLGLAHLDYHIATARRYIELYNRDISATNKSCFEFGSIWPDLPDVDIITEFAENPNTGNFSLDIAIELAITQFDIDVRKHIIEVILMYYNRNSSNQNPKIDEIINFLKESISNSIPEQAKNTINDAMDTLIKKTLQRYANRTYNSHYGNDSEYHAMAANTRTRHIDTYKNFKDKLKNFINGYKNNSCCKKWEDLGKALHMLTDLHTASHAQVIHTNGEVTVEHFFFYHEEDNKRGWHAERDHINDSQINASAKLLNLILRNGIDNQISVINNNIPSYPLYSNNNINQDKNGNIH